MRTMVICHASGSGGAELYPAGGGGASCRLINKFADDVVTQTEEFIPVIEGV